MKFLNCHLHTLSSGVQYKHRDQTLSHGVLQEVKNNENSSKKLTRAGRYVYKRFRLYRNCSDGQFWEVVADGDSPVFLGFTKNFNARKESARI